MWFIMSYSTLIWISNRCWVQVLVTVIFKYLIILALDYVSFCSNYSKRSQEIFHKNFHPQLFRWPIFFEKHTLHESLPQVFGGVLHIVLCFIMFNGKLLKRKYVDFYYLRLWIILFISLSENPPSRMRPIYWYYLFSSHTNTNSIYHSIYLQYLRNNIK